MILNTSCGIKPHAFLFFSYKIEPKKKKSIRTSSILLEATASSYFETIETLENPSIFPHLSGIWTSWYCRHILGWYQLDHRFSRRTCVVRTQCSTHTHARTHTKPKIHMNVWYHCVVYTLYIHVYHESLFSRCIRSVLYVWCINS